MMPYGGIFRHFAGCRALFGRRKARDVERARRSGLIAVTDGMITKAIAMLASGLHEIIASA
jgi:hypothetical protein